MTENKKYATFRMYESTRDKLKYVLLPMIKGEDPEIDNPSMIEVVDDLVNEKVDEIEKENE